MAAPIPTDYKALPELVGERIVEVLTEYCKTSLAAIPEAADYTATVVRQGLPQENPVKDRIAIFVNPNDPSDLSNEPKRSDSVTSIDPHEPFRVSPYELGGGERRWLHFTVTIKVYLMRTREDRDEARQIGQWVFGRAQQAIRDNKTLNLVDCFGERALFMFVEKVHKYEGGGPPKSLTWEGSLYVTALAEAE
jgi:hypothetical protein